MKYKLIAAISENGIIGVNNNLPWNISEDLQHFKQLTINNIVIMGSNTALSIRPLKNRLNIVLTKNAKNHNYQNILDSFIYVRDICVDKFTYACDHFIYIDKNHLPDLLREFPDKKIFIIGGSQIYSEFINLCDELYLTIVYKNIKTSKTDMAIYFPKINFSNFTLFSNQLLFSNNESCYFEFKHFKLF